MMRSSNYIAQATLEVTFSLTQPARLTMFQLDDPRRTVAEGLLREEIMSTSSLSLTGLLDLITTLRGPKGCPWDRAQTITSQRHCVVETAREAARAIEQQDSHDLCEGLADVLSSIVFLARLSAEQGRFDLAAVIAAAEAKLIRRHPYVFGDDPLAPTASPPWAL
jgi:uncharacterized protein YabN with tetrapyrrole methylase and pyrophosphatase domain